MNLPIIWWLLLSYLVGCCSGMSIMLIYAAGRDLRKAQQDLSHDQGAVDAVDGLVARIEGRKP